MSIFGAIKDAIWGKKAEAAPAPAPTPAVEAAPVEAAPAPAPAETPMTRAEIESLLGQIASTTGSDLNWQTSIVDLMKLIGLDPSLANRKELAEELGYTGEKDGSAEMNIWLHEQVMSRLAAHGGTTPEELTR
ncbi:MULTISPECIES: DUF3597 domain-containing protein [Sphingomonas]|uniref:DUF3597 domain-containing protein n=1 Tax=Sphingomonas TaxID=13687 RepID=UPI000830620F|nr:DUF3597 domain-containing protein [Sphingomonas sp. CCH10-B3]MBA3878631.1 DUF3597 domain-containing protein [Sphingobium sp.]